MSYIDSIAAPIATFIRFLIAILIASLPLHLAVKFVGGKTGFFKVFIVNLVVGIIVPLIYVFVNKIAGIVAFIAILFVYKKFFKIGWIKAFLVWILVIVFVILIELIIKVFRLAF